jgi:hypothetical protein
MAIDTYIIGNDGNVVIGSTVNVLKVRSFAATLQRVSSDLTGFGDSGRRRRLGMIDLTGSLTGVAAIDSTASTSSSLTATSNFFGVNTQYALTLKIFEGTAATADVKMTSNVVFDQFAFNSDKTGDATVTANFANSDGAAPVVTWRV